MSALVVDKGEDCRLNLPRTLALDVAAGAAVTDVKADIGRVGCRCIGC